MTLSPFQGLDKTTLAEIVAGDTVACRTSQYFRGPVYSFQVIARTTATQLLFGDGRRFARATGREINPQGSGISELFALAYCQPPGYGSTAPALPMVTVVQQARVAEAESQRRVQALREIRTLVGDDRNLVLITPGAIEAALALLKGDVYVAS